MAEDVPEGFNVAFSHLRRVHDEMYASIKLQTTIFEDLILKARQSELSSARHKPHVNGISHCNAVCTPADEPSASSCKYVRAQSAEPPDDSDVEDDHKEIDNGRFRDSALSISHRDSVEIMDESPVFLREEFSSWRPGQEDDALPQTLEKMASEPHREPHRTGSLDTEETEDTVAVDATNSLTFAQIEIGYQSEVSEFKGACDTGSITLEAARASAYSLRQSMVEGSSEIGPMYRPRSMVEGSSEIGPMYRPRTSSKFSRHSLRVSRASTIRESIATAGHHSSMSTLESSKSVSFCCPVSTGASMRWETLVHKVMLHWLSGKKTSILHLKSVWEKETNFDWTQIAARIDAAASRSTNTTRTSEYSANAIAAGATVTGTSCLQRCVIHPDNFFGKLLLIIGGLALVYDIVTVPYMLSFEIAATGVFFALNLSMTIFWTVDMFASSLTGYYDKILIEMRPVQCLLHYMKTWGVLDLVINLSDWVSLSISMFDSEAQDTNTVVSASRVLKYYRFLRILRMFRLFKLLHSLGSYIDGVATEMMLVFLKLVCIVLVIFLLNHYIACCFCALALNNSVDTDTWMRQLQMENTSNAYQYVVAIHWAMTQFTPATNNVYPMNMRERVFAFFVVFFALIMFSSFLSGLASAMAQIKKIQVERYEEEGKIRRFIFERQVSLNCARRIWCFYRTYYKSAPVTMCYNDVAFLKKLPRPLRLTLHADISAPILTTHPVFNYICTLDNPAMLIICDKGLQEIGYSAQNEVFHVGDKAEYVYFLNTGSVVYECDMDYDVQCLNAPQTVTEAALWASWLHRGTLTTTSLAHIVLLDVDAFTRFIEVHGQGATLCCLKIYARGFIDLANVGYDEMSITDVARDGVKRMINQACQNAFAPYVRASTLSSLPSSVASVINQQGIIKRMASIGHLFKRKGSLLGSLFPEPTFTPS